MLQVRPGRECGSSVGGGGVAVGSPLLRIWEKGQGLPGKGVEVGNGIHGELRLLTGMGRGVTGPERPMQTPPSLTPEQRLLQIQDKGKEAAKT